MGTVAVFALVDYLGQMILLYRCWIIWDRRWIVVAFPGLLALVTFGGGFTLLGLYSSTNEKLFEIIGTMTYSISLSVNTLTTALIVIKIFLISQDVCPDPGSHSHLSLRIIVAMLIESGLLLFAFQLIFVILFFARLPALEIISGATTQIYGITPTLLSIRVVMGSAYDRTTEKTRSVRFARSGGPRMSIDGIQTRAIDIDLDDVLDNERTPGNNA
ncbi:hypothetical protein BD779DRAFT_1805748, partial [Infundibulicybe gibba]